LVQWFTSNKIQLKLVVLDFPKEYEKFFSSPIVFKIIRGLKIYQQKICVVARLKHFSAKL